ncbi:MULTISPECIES: amidase [Pseudonocardia]|uniref:Acylamidase n=2 Tax=Pseudonocardia TaxID=1847 RepID=A0A1Y2MSF5_PSEAH|nr:MULTISPECIES: amidase [Pseudonocardia]OSY38154.1 Acylamidase [Pseudonocardia autotrophica]TDN75594.1 amidase [Pseudonocardia autotrophica]GEC27804.1 amidase [Pseudonocardia saturnea]
MTDTEPTWRSAGELAGDLAARRISAVELADETIARIERLDPALNAVCVPDFERARRAAVDADAALARGERRPLLGVPLTVKESFRVAGLPSTWGLTEHRDAVADTDAVAVQRVRAAGAVVLGTTNVPPHLGDLQTFNDVYGTTVNPWDHDRTPGGSSGGSAAALAAGFGPLSLGSDLGGSLRYPAHCCGVYAHKPSLGLLPPRGHTPPGLPALPTEHDLAVIGPMARTAADLDLLLDVLAGPDELTGGVAYRLALPAARHTELRGHRVLVLDGHPLLPGSAPVRAAIDGFAEALAGAGVTVLRESPLLPDQAESARIYMRILHSGLAAGFPPEAYDRARADAALVADDDRSLAAERARGAVLSHRDRVAAESGRELIRQRWRELFAEFDLVIAPIAPTTAIPHDHSDLTDRRITVDGVEYPYFDQLAPAGTATLPGLPATALPIGLSGDGLPIGVQAIGPMFGDRTTIAFARFVEREFGGAIRPPGV